MKIRFSYLMLLMALAVAATAGYFSVWGLSQLFAGASTAVIIMASILEIAKVVTTTALHRYWTKLSKGLKGYLTVGVIVLMLITSAGIYGFLSNAYQMTANKLEIHEGQLGVLDTKKTSFEKSVVDNEKIIATKNKRIDQLTNLRNNQETRLDSAKYTRAKDKARADIKEATKEIQKLTDDIDVLNLKNNVLSDSANKYNVKILELKAGNEVARDIGPLKYVSELTGQPMAEVVNFLILLLIFVFDPLAIALILATNRAFDIESDGEFVFNNKPTPKPSNSPEKPIIETTPVKEPVTLENTDIDEGEISDFVESYVEDMSTAHEPKHLQDASPLKKEPVIPTGKIEVDDIKEIKEIKSRGFSVPVPDPKTNNTIERIGSNKIVKDGDRSKFFFRRNK